MIRKLLVLSIVLVAAFATVANAQTTAQIHGDPGCAPSPFDLASVTYNGTVYAQAGTYNSGSTYFQDANGGTLFFESANPLLNGDNITVQGIVGAFGDEIQLNTATWALTSSGNPLYAVSFGTGDLADGTDQLGNFLEAEGVLTLVSSGFNSTYTIDDGSGPLLIFVDGTTGIDQTALNLMLGDYVRIRGASKCYAGQGEILPRNDGDITLLFVENDESSFSQIKARF